MMRVSRLRHEERKPGRASVWVLIAMAVAAPLASGNVGRVDSDEVGTGFVGDEPNVPSGGALPFAGGRYAGDDNGLASALDGVPTEVLAVEWVPRACVYGVACEDLAAPVLRNLIGHDTILPGTGQFQAWAGTFADVDGDGWIRPRTADDNLHASLKGDCRGATPWASLRGDDPDSIGKAQGVPTGLSVRCTRETEWVGGDVDIVAYVTPGDWNGADVLNRGFHAWNPLRPPPPEDPRSPDLAFRPVPPSLGQGPTGRYFAPGSGADLVMVDNSLLETTVVEAFTRPAASIDGTRSLSPGAASRVDVDVYSSVDPTVAAVWHAFVAAPLAEQGCDLARPEAGCRAATDPVTEPIRTRKDDDVAIVGFAIRRFFPEWERLPQAGVDYAEPHAYLNVFVETSAAVSLVKTHFNSDNALGDYAPFSNAEVSPAGDGRVHATPQVSLMARLGIWKDENADGWIGAPQPSRGCPDAHDCGARPNPHEYDDAREFTPLCGAQETIARGADGSFTATLVPEGGNWGRFGVYVLTDRTEVSSGEDPLEEGATSPYAPYDDAPSALVFRGPVTLNLLCTHERPGFYRSYERLLFPEGSNLDHAIHIVGSTTLAFAIAGMELSEPVVDVDVVQGWVA